MSLDFYEVVLEVEEEFGIKLPDSRWSAVVSVGDLADATLEALRQQQPRRFTDSAYPERVWGQLKALLVTQLGLAPEQIVPSARFYDDLGLR